MRKTKQRLTQLNNQVNNKKRKSNSELILLFIAETLVEASGNIKWLMAMVGVALAVLIALVMKGG